MIMASTNPAVGFDESARYANAGIEACSSGSMAKGLIPQRLISL
jgi:hypothetical protein